MVLKIFSLVAIFFLASCVSIERNNPEDPGSINYQSSETFNGVHGTPVTYEGETYQTVVIGTQTWFQRNLNYAVGGSKCGKSNNTILTDENTEACKTYGRLYDWATAMKLPSDCNSTSCASQISDKHQGICPDGWHIPSEADWGVLMQDETSNCFKEDLCFNTGTKLKAAKGWNLYGEIPAGTDDYGFSALPGGYGERQLGFSGVDNFLIDMGKSAGWWSSTELRERNDASAGVRFVFSESEKAFDYTAEKIDSHSIRCLKD